MIPISYELIQKRGGGNTLQVIFETRFTLLPKPGKSIMKKGKLKSNLPHRHDYKNLYNILVNRIQ